MLSSWSQKCDARPNFSTIVTRISTNLEGTSDYLVVVKEKEKTEKTEPELEDNPELSINHVPCNPNDYYIAGPAEQ